MLGPHLSAEGTRDHPVLHTDPDAEPSSAELGAQLWTHGAQALPEAVNAR